MSIAPTLTPGEFAARWRDVETSEKASAQAHFIDLCRLLGQPAPHEADPTGQSYAFEKALEKTVGEGGFADVWKRDFFGWEYKGKRKDLRPPTSSSSSTARPWATRRSSSCRTSIGSRSTRNSPG